VEDPRGRVSEVEFNLNQVDNYVSPKQQKLNVNNISRWRMNTHDINPPRGRRPTPTRLSQLYLHLPPQGHGVYYLPLTQPCYCVSSLIRFPPSAVVDEHNQISTDES